MNIIIGVDYHPSVQQIAFVEKETGECGERQLNHSDGEAEKFYRDLKLRGVQVRVGMEATGHARWFERLLAELQYELWVGDPAQIKAARVRKQKTDRRDAGHILKLMVEDRFPRVSLEDLMKVEIDSVYGASGYKQKTTDAAASTTIITADEIKRYGYRTLADILRSVPGFLCDL